MTVKEAKELLTDAEELIIRWDGETLTFNKNNEIMLIDAFGKYKIKEINSAYSPAHYILELLMLPVKEQ